uniref:Uncharacterized protein n=1 Tax=viral metagenome TaxID=1070528 RepID=A0A6C0KDD6_9ZZZZ
MANPIDLPEKKQVVTEDLGKICEKAVCLLIPCEFQGEYRYSLDKAMTLRNRLVPLTAELQGFLHTGRTDNLYDFSHSTDVTKKLSVKTNKTGWMVCPQGGQGTKKTFCEKFVLPVAAHTDPEAIKAFVLAETPRVLDIFMHSTFHCQTLYYNEPANLVQMIKQVTPIDWSAQLLKFSHLEKGKIWNESTTLYLNHNGNLITIGEFQNHKHRNCFKFRWQFKNLLDHFKNHFEIRTL